MDRSGDDAEPDQKNRVPQKWACLFRQNEFSGAGDAQTVNLTIQQDTGLCAALGQIFRVISWENFGGGGHFGGHNLVHLYRPMFGCVISTHQGCALKQSLSHPHIGLVWHGQIG